MNKNSHTGTQGDQRLDAIIADYLRLKQSGKPPDPEAFAAEHPDFADELKDFFADQEKVDQVFAPLGKGLPEGPEDDSLSVEGSEKKDEFAETYISGPVSVNELPPTRADRYSLKRFHARGGMGEVWLAEDTQIGREVAVKKLRSERPAYRERFFAEAQITGQLEHPSIVPVYDLATDESGEPYYVMQFVRGTTLKDAIAEYYAEDDHSRSETAAGDPKQVAFHQLIEVFLDLCQAVAYAHSRGVVHRDLKPDNVMLGAFGETLLLDWGLAKVKGEPEDPRAAAYVRTSISGSTETQAGSVLGSPAYMSPEAASGQVDEIDEASDVYLLGATLYEILTHHPPRRGSSLPEMVELARTVEPTPPRKLNKTVPRALEAICLKAMQRRRQDRYSTASDLATDIQRYLAGEPVTAYREGPIRRLWRWCRRNRRRVEMAAALTAIAAASLFGFAKLREAEQLRARERAHQQVAEFRRLAEDVRFFSTSADSRSETAPYYDLERGAAVAKQAFSIANGWGPQLTLLPLVDERTALKQNLYDLLLSQAQMKLREPEKRETTQEAIALLARAAKFAKPTRAYYRLRARCNELLGEAEQSEKNRRRAEDPRTPTTALDHFLKGESYRLPTSDRPARPGDEEQSKTVEQQLEMAIEQFQLALGLQPDHYWSHLQLCRCYLGLERPSEAVAAAATSVALRPKAPWAYCVRGLAFAKEGRYARALADLDRVIREHPDFLPARMNRGFVHLLQKDDARAYKDFDHIMQADEEKRLAGAAYYRGQIQFRRENWDAARIDFDWIIKWRPGFARAYYARADLHFAKGADELALRDLDTYLLLTTEQFDPKSWQAHHARGGLLLDFHDRLPVGETDERARLSKLARQELAEAERLGGTSSKLFEDLGGLLERTNRRKDAMVVYDKGLEHAPNSVNLHIRRAWLQALWRQKYDLAEKDFEEAIRLDAENAEARTGLGYVQAVSHKHDTAERQAVQAMLLKGGDYLVLHNVACIYAELAESDRTRTQKHHQSAIDVLRRAVELWKRQGAPTGTRSMPSLMEMEKQGSFRTLQLQPDFKQLMEAARSKDPVRPTQPK